MLRIYFIDSNSASGTHTRVQLFSVSTALVGYKANKEVSNQWIGPIQSLSQSPSYDGTLGDDSEPQVSN